IFPLYLIKKFHLLLCTSLVFGCWGGGLSPDEPPPRGSVPGSGWGYSALMSSNISWETRVCGKYSGYRTCLKCKIGPCLFLKRFCFHCFIYLLFILCYA